MRTSEEPDDRLGRAKPAPEPEIQARLRPPVPGKLSRHLIAAAVLVVMGLAGGGIYAWRNVTAQRDLAHRLDPQLLDPSNPLQAEAVKLADRLVKDFPGDVKALFIRGLILNKFVSRDVAARCWEECVQRQPDFGEAYYWLGKEWFKKGEYEKALHNLRRAVEFKAPVADVRMQLADALINAGQPGEAVSVLREQVRVAPQEVAGWFYLGHTCALLGRLDEAAENYRHALDVNPDCHQAWHGLALISQKHGERDKAREYFQKFQELQDKFFARHQAAKRGPNEGGSLERALATAYTDAGRIYASNNGIAVAEACWLRAGKVDPDQTDSRMLLLGLYRQQNLAAAAVPVLEQLRRIQPENPSHCLNLGTLRLMLGQVDGAEEAFTRLIELAPQRVEGYAALADLYLQTGRKLSKATELAQRAVKLQPDAENYFLLSEACARYGDRGGAKQAIARAIELDPHNLDYQRFRDEL